MTLACVRFTEPAFHNWQGAPKGKEYLGQRHRHLFHVEVCLEVLHDDREVEFHDLLSFSRASFPGKVIQGIRDAALGYGPVREMGGLSCEMMARAVRTAVVGKWTGRTCIVSVYEDGEVGAEVSE